MMLPLILIGGGGHCKSVIDAAESAGFSILGILDQPEKVGQEILGYKVIGTDDDIPGLAGKAAFVITVGQILSSDVRRRIARKVEEAGGSFATVIARDACVSRHARIGEGSVILHKAVVNAGARIGRNCIINTMANIEHDASVGDFCHISTGVTVNGETQVGQDCFIGSGSTLYHCIHIADQTVIPAGSIIKKSVGK